MKQLILLGIASAVIAAPAAAPAAPIPDSPTTSETSTGINLRLTVGVSCSVRHQAGGLGAPSGGAISLGTLREYCNSPRGYELLVTYAPGSLRGARIIAGDDQVVLDGSCLAVLSRSPGPRIRERPVSAVPGEHGFDTSRFELQIIPS
jgi:hypothetical protein